MNIETTRTVELYRSRARWCEGLRNRMSPGYSRDTLSADLRDNGQPLAEIRLHCDGTEWNCFADTEAIESLRADGYTVEVKRKDRHKRGRNRNRFHLALSGYLDGNPSDEMEPWQHAAIREATA